MFENVDRWMPFMGFHIQALCLSNGLAKILTYYLEKAEGAHRKFCNLAWPLSSSSPPSGDWSGNSWNDRGIPYNLKRPPRDMGYKSSKPVRLWSLWKGILTSLLSYRDKLEYWNFPWKQVDELSLKAPITTEADNKFCNIILNFKRKKEWFSWESSAIRRFSWNIMPYLLFLKKRQNLLQIIGGALWVIFSRKCPSLDLPWHFVVFHGICKIFYGFHRKSSNLPWIP